MHGVSTNEAGRRTRSPLLVIVALFCAAAVALAGCGTTGSSPRPSPSLIEIDFTPSPSPLVTSGPTPFTPPTSPPWPLYWDVAFCDALFEAVIAQELIVDIERALAEEAIEDARGLATELRDAAAHASELLSIVPEWNDGEEVALELATVMDLASRAGNDYVTYFTNNRRQALRRARELREENLAAVPPANAALAELAQRGLGCPGIPLRLEGG